MFTTTRYILLTAIRDWFFIALFIALMFAVSISYFLGGTALSEQEQMVISYISGSSRAILMVGLMVFVCFHVRRAFDNREIELILSRPISRGGFVVSYWLGFAVLSFLLVIPVVILLSIFTVVSFSGLALWAATILLESFIVVAFALFISLILKSAVSSVLGSFGFYIISRMMGFFILLINSHFYQSFSASFIMSKLVYIISMVLPRLDLFGKSNWLIYGAGNEILWVYLAQAVIYVAFLLAMAISDFKRRQF